jgi:hypothetical protein
MMGSCQGAGRGVVQDDGDHRCLQRRRALDGQIDRSRGFGLNPVADTAKGAVGFKRRADGSDQLVESAGPAIGGLDNDFQLGAVLVVKTQWRQRDFGLTWLAVPQDDQSGGRDAFRQVFVPQGNCGVIPPEGRSKDVAAVG